MLGISVQLRPHGGVALAAFVAIGVSIVVLFRRHLMPAYGIGTRALRTESRMAFKRGIPSSDDIVNAAAVEWAQLRIAILVFLILFTVTATFVDTAVNAQASPLFEIVLSIWLMSRAARTLNRYRSFTASVRIAAST